MNVKPVEMSTYQAREAFIAYRKAVQTGQAAEDAELMAGYSALARGKRVISLSASIRLAGADARGLPLLAVARADSKRCEVMVDQGGAAIFLSNGAAAWGRAAADNRIEVRRVCPNGQAVKYAHALVPIIPPQLRPKAALDGYHVLWEAEWHLQPPTDPLLLRRIGRDLFVVLAQWDLTPLERLVVGAMR